MEIMLAAIAGYLLAQLRLQLHKRALAYGERIMEQSQAECAANLKRNFDALFAAGPVRLSVDAAILRIDYASTLCPGTHFLELKIAEESRDYRKHVADYFAERIATTNFTRISIEP